ncbi:MAG: hypothetical protein Q8O99_01580 [bacterium]|nr:hypothetical protein [bacterium]
MERTFAKEIIPLVEGHTPASLLVLNGPGSFTTLRIGCLAVNLLKQYSSHTFVLYTISKLQLYQAAYQAGILPTYMGIFL